MQTHSSKRFTRVTSGGLPAMGLILKIGDVVIGPTTAVAQQKLTATTEGAITL